MLGVGLLPATLVALGGALGTVLRWLVSVGLARAGLIEFPWGTFVVNVLGSFALGLLAETTAERRWLGVEARLVLGTGVMGGFTTYSTFNLETLRMLERGEHGKAALYVAATLALCLLAGLAGLALGRAAR